MTRKRSPGKTCPHPNQDIDVCKLLSAGMSQHSNSEPNLSEGLSQSNHPAIPVATSSYTSGNEPTVVFATEVEARPQGGSNNYTAGYAIPIYAESVQPVSNNGGRNTSPRSSNYPQSITIQTPSFHVTMIEQQIPENVVTVYTFSRSLKCLTIIDTITIVISSIFNLFWLFFLWGPLAGFYGVTKHKLYFVYCYAIYWILRILFDLLYVLTGFWWHIVLLIIDLYILRYVRIHILALRSLTSDQLELLRQIQSNPSQGNGPLDNA
jgi:hypothetical protein